MEVIKCIKKLIENSKRIVVFTGAGISVPSGIPDFRSADGLYNQKTGYNTKPEEIISHSFYMKHTQDFYQFYKNKMVYENATPNAAHNYFATLEKTGKNVIVITQNIDGLHSIAGSKTVYEIHGSIHKNHCMKCKKFYDLKSVINAKSIPYCNCGGIIKPDVVLYEEELDYQTIARSINAIEEGDLLIVIGTSLIVQPAASFIRYFHGDNLIIINKEKTPYDKYAKYAINDDVINVIKKLESLQ